LCDKVAAEKGRRRRRRRRLGIQNQKQEPHTKLWGIKKSSVKVVELSGTNVDCESFGAVK
jgi:hypothetical protein